MKGLTAIYCVLWSVAAMAIAGPEEFSGKEMKQVAPMPPACPNWTGFYVGAFAGYKFSNVDTDIEPDSLFQTAGAEIADPLQANAPGNLDNSGAELGGVIGYNYQWHNWIFGLEGSAGYLWASEWHDTGFFNVPAANVDLDITTSFETHYLATFGPRIGYAFCRWLPYVTGGLAVGDLEFSQSFAAVRNPQVGFVSGGHETDTNVGWMVGGGLEYALTNHWRLRGQYQYIDLGDVGFRSVASGTLQGAGLFTTHHGADLTEHNASFALLYKF